MSSDNIVRPVCLVERTPEAVYAEISAAWVTLADLYAELGRSMNERRRSRGLSQKAIGEATGLTRDQVNSYEMGIRWKSDAPGIERLVLFLTTGRRFGWAGGSVRRRKSLEREVRDA